MPTPNDTPALDVAALAAELRDWRRQAAKYAQNPGAHVGAVVLLEDKALLWDAALTALRAAQADAARLAWVEQRGYCVMCWNVGVTPDNGWTIGSDTGEMDDIASGPTWRECVDNGMQRESAAHTPAPRFIDESPTETYERLAAEFYADTGMMAPGKDQPGEMGGPSYAERFARWTAWDAARTPAPTAEPTP